MLIVMALAVAAALLAEIPIGIRIPVGVKAMLLLPLFLLLILLSRGVTVWLYRNDLARNERASFVLCTSMGSPIPIVVTHIGVEPGRIPR